MLKKLILSLALGSSAFATVASAAPCNDAPAPAPAASTVSIVKPGYNTVLEAPVARPRWRSMTLASNTTFERNGSRTIAVGKRDGAFESLQITSSYGDPMIRKVEITFANGTRMVKSIGDRVRPGQGLTIALDRDGDGDQPRAIHSVTVFGGEHIHGRERTQGTFNLIGIR
jgi:hypothetical protein